MMFKKKLQVLKELKELAEEVGKALERREPGADIPLAKALLLEAAVALEKGDIEQAFSLTQEAKKYAEPRPFFLSDKAKEFCKEADEALKQEEYEKALNLYSRARQEYEKALQLARSRGETKTAQSIKEALNTVSHDIEVVLFKKDVALVNSLIAKANTLIRRAEKAFKGKDYARALKSLEEAKGHLRQALETAKKRRLEVIDEIKDTLSTVKQGIVNALIAGTEKRIADANIKGKVEKILKEIPKLSLPQEEGERLLWLAKKRIVTIELERGKALISKAEKLVKEKDYVAALNEYRRTKDLLGEALKRAVDWELLEEKQKLDWFIDLCVENIRSLERAVIEAKPVKPQEIVVTRPRGLETWRREASISLEKLGSRYAVHEFLGEGGFARVYKAKKCSTGELVAIKVFKSLSEDAEASFKREIEAWSKLDHENIVKRRDWGISPPFIEMELANSSLAKLKKPLPLRKVCRYGFEICRALNHAHSKGIYHRDLKPSNLLLFGDKVKVSDWGLARLSDLSTTTTSLRDVGTIFYMAPEQFEGKADTRTDIYQLGVVLYELITGRRPFEGDTDPLIMKKILHEEPPKPSLLNPEAGKLEPLILKCLEKEPGKRFQTARELQYAIADMMSREYGERLEFSQRREDRAEKVKWLAELVLICLKIGEISRALGYARALHEETGSEEVAGLCKEFEVRLKEGVEVSGERLREIESMLLKYAV